VGAKATVEAVVSSGLVLLQNLLLIQMLQLHQQGLQNSSQHYHCQSLHCSRLTARLTSNLFDQTIAFCGVFVETSLLAYCVVINASLACGWLCRRVETNCQISIYVLSVWSEAS